MNVYALKNCDYSHNFGSFSFTLILAANNEDEAKYIIDKYQDWRNDSLEGEMVFCYSDLADLNKSLLKNTQYNGDKPTILADFYGDITTDYDFYEGYKEFEKECREFEEYINNKTK